MALLVTTTDLAAWAAAHGVTLPSGSTLQETALTAAIAQAQSLHETTAFERIGRQLEADLAQFNYPVGFGERVLTGEVELDPAVGAGPEHQADYAVAQRHHVAFPITGCLPHNVVSVECDQWIEC